MPTANINGYKMYYEAKGKGFPLAYIHGGMGGLGTGEVETPTWRERFARHFRVITYHPSPHCASPSDKSSVE